MRAALINNATNKVINIIVADPAVDTPPFEGHSLVAATSNVQIGFDWDGASFIDTRPPPEPKAPSIPSVISSRKLRLQLRIMGRLAAMKTYITNADEPTQIYFEYENYIRRDAPEILAMQTHFSLTDQQMDNLFVAADQL